MKFCLFHREVQYFLLFFKNGDAEDITNYRPISLTNVDYRILAFVLAARLLKGNQFNC